MQPTSRAPRWPALWIAAAAAAGVLVALVLALAWRARGAREPAPLARAPVQVATASIGAGAGLATGRLELVALPWAHVESIRDADGKEWATPAAVTPLLLTLPPGTYTAVLRHPSAAGTKTATIVVRAGQTTRQRVDLAVMDADRYLRALDAGAPR